MMDLPSVPSPTLYSSSQASAAWPPILHSTGSLPSSSHSTPEQSPLPTTFLTKAKRDEPQCRMPVKTWPGGGTSSTTITVELPCGSPPWNTVGSPITEGSPQQPAVAIATTPTTASAAQQPTTTTQQGSSSSSTIPPNVLHMGEGGVAAIISVLSVAVLGAAIGFYFWGRKMGIIRGRKGNQNAVQGF